MVLAGWYPSCAAILEALDAEAEEPAAPGSGSSEESGE